MIYMTNAISDQIHEVSAMVSEILIVLVDM